MQQIKHLFGVYRAVVADDNDPLKQNRVKLYIQTNPTEKTDWVWSLDSASMHTKAPSIGQGVWVMFEGGDPSFPVWLGEFGKHQAKSKKMYIKPLDNTTSLTGLTPYLIVNNQPDGTAEVDLVASLLAMAAKLKDHETRVASMESQLATIHATLATRTSPSHTHGSNG